MKRKERANETDREDDETPPKSPRAGTCLKHEDQVSYLLIVHLI